MAVNVRSHREDLGLISGLPSSKTDVQTASSRTIVAVLSAAFLFCITAPLYLAGLQPPVTQIQVPPPVTRQPFFIGILTAPKNFDRRQRWRAHCGNDLRQAGFEFKFILGRASADSRSPLGNVEGQLATNVEQDITLDLMKEAETHSDMLFTTGREYFRDLTDKTLHVFEHGYATGARFIVKLDDYMCPDVQQYVALEATNTYDNDRARMLYGGSYLWKGTEYGGMKGPHGERSKYFSGMYYVVSRNLVKAIIVDNNAYSYSWEYYGNASEDSNVGKWVEYVKKMCPNTDIVYDAHFKAQKVH